MPSPAYKEAGPGYVSLGRDKGLTRLGWRSTCSPGPGQRFSAWAGVPLCPASRLGRRLSPGWAGTQPPGRADSSPGRRPLIRPGWACLPAGLAGKVPRLGRDVLTQLGRFLCSGWAASSSSPRTRLGRIRRIRPGRDFLLQAAPCNPGWARLSTPAGPDYTVPAGPGRDPWPRPDYYLTGRVIPL
jgi:hypothetical protein